MGLERDVPCAKGAICHGLDEFSKGRGARERITKLRNAIAALAPTYAGLTEVFDQYLLAYAFNASQRRQACKKLNENWFDPDSAAALFRGTPVNRIYAEGVRRTLDLSLKGARRPVPIEAWWIVDSTEFRMLNLANLQGGRTMGPAVTLLIMTPRPAAGGPTVPARILGDAAEAFTTEQKDGATVTRRVKTIR
jgi:hypothetical protein